MKSILMMFLAMQMATSHFALASAPTTFEQAKVELRQKVYYDRNTSEAGDLYCGCDWKWVGGHAEIRRKFIHLGCRLLFCKAFLQKWPHQSRGLVKVLDAVERDAIKPAEKRFG